MGPNWPMPFGPHASLFSNWNWELPVMETKTAQIRALNDAMRQSLVGGMAVTTPGIAALGQEAVARTIKTIEVYDDFCHANDPHEEHDFGAFDADGKRVSFKIDYYDESLFVNHAPLTRHVDRRQPPTGGPLDGLTLSAPTMA
jgi:hypothetical protein